MYTFVNVILVLLTTIVRGPLRLIPIKNTNQRTKIKENIN